MLLACYLGFNQDYLIYVFAEICLLLLCVAFFMLFLLNPLCFDLKLRNINTKLCTTLYHKCTNKLHLNISTNCLCSNDNKCVCGVDCKSSSTEDNLTFILEEKGAGMRRAHSAERQGVLMMEGNQG